MTLPNNVRRRLTPVFAGWGLLACSLAFAQTLPIPPSGDYVVQHGDTLESIAQKFLGASDRWKEILAANPGISNPHFIKPGSHIKITAQSISAKRATIQQVFRQVEQMPFPRPWAPAAVGGVLQPRDGVRTFEKSSSELEFDNDTRMVVSEDSVIFLREIAASPENVSRKAIEIRAGQADLDVRQGTSSQKNSVEFHIGSTQGTTRPGSGGKGSSRARRADDGGSRIMVYDGDGEVSTAGRTVAVPTGMGIAVTADGRTNGPETLLQAPKPLSPNESQSFDFSNPTFDWEPVPAATSYTVEICRDPSCGQLVDRAVGVQMTRWTPRVLPIGVLYWRVSASSRSGLDSYLSPAQKFTIRTYWRRPVDRS